MDVTSFSHVFLISWSWYHTETVASMNLVIVVQSCSLTLLFMMTHKFSIGFRSGELPGQSRNEMLWSEKKIFDFFWRMAWCQFLLKDTIPIRKCLLHIWNYSSLDNFNVLVTFHHSLNRKMRTNSFEAKVSRNIFFAGCFTCWLMWHGFTLSPTLRLTYWTCFPPTTKWVSSEKRTFFQSSRVQFLYFLTQASLFTFHFVC